MLQEVRCEACGRRFDMASARFQLAPRLACPTCGSELGVLVRTQSAVRASAVEAEASGEPITVFIGDQDSVALFALSARIEEETDMHVVGATGKLAAALVIIRTTHPMVVLLDHLLAGDGEADGARRVRAQAPSAKLVVCSSGSVELAERVHGADAYMRKSEPMATVSQTLHRLVGEPQVARRN
jgi:CheY-like chemotaxis protein